MKTSVIFAAIILGCATPSLADRKAEAAQTGVQLMDRAGETRMLTQRMLRRACYINTGAGLGIGDVVALENDIDRLNGTYQLLAEGNERIEAIKSPRVKLMLADAQDAWLGYSNFARFALRGEMPDAYLNGMAAGREGMIEAQENLVTAMARTYGFGRIDPYQANTISTLARLRMLSNLISVEHCLVTAGVSYGSEEALRAAKERFMSSLEMLQAGSEADRILPPSPEMSEAYTCIFNAFNALDATLRDQGISNVAVTQLRPFVGSLEAAADAAVKQLKSELVGLPAGNQTACEVVAA